MCDRGIQVDIAKVNIQQWQGRVEFEKATEDDHREDSVTEGKNNKASRSQQDRITGSKARCWASLPHKKNEEDRADKLGLRRCAGVSAGREQETQQGHACVKSTTGDIIQVHNLK